MTNFLVLAALCATVAHAGPAGEAEHASRLEARLEAALERILGPGRSAATVEVKGERVTKREQAEISGAGGGAPAAAPASPSASAGSPILDLPGYTKKGAAPVTTPAQPAASSLLLHSSSEETVREGSFAVSGLRAWVFLDKGLSDEAAAEAVRVSIELLAVDPDRGDTFKVVRTSFMPAWRAALSRPRGAGALALLAVACAAALLCAAMLGFAATRSSRALSEAIRGLRGPPPAPAQSGPPLPARRILPLPPLEEGGRDA